MTFKERQIAIAQAENVLFKETNDLLREMLYELNIEELKILVGYQVNDHLTIEEITDPDEVFYVDDADLHTINHLTQAEQKGLIDHLSLMASKFHNIFYTPIN